MHERELDALQAYAVKIRRQLHEYPEVGFDLPRTAALVAGELKAMGLQCTDRYGMCSLSAEIGAGPFCVALRADMDALPLEEKTGLPFRSRIPGQMHACGHDAHTAILLAAARYLVAHEKELPCRVRLIFQPSEEGAVSGAKMMVDAGVMDGVDHVVGIHCENALDTGCIGLCAGDYQAACIPATLRFHGRSAHATLPENGADAIAMAAEAYDRLRRMVREEAGGRPYIWSVGRFSGGHVHNVIAAECAMDVSFRFYDVALAARVEARVREICNEAASSRGGSWDMDWYMSTGPVHNDARLVERFRQAAQGAGLPVRELERRMSSEDFGWYLTKAPGLLFRFGTRNEARGCTALAHCGDFCMDEEGMRAGIRAFVAYVLGCKEV